MTDPADNLRAAPTRAAPNRHPAGFEREVDALGRTLAVGDSVTALRGRSVSLAVVERVSRGRVVLLRGDGMKAVVKSSAVVLIRPVLDTSARGA